MKPDIVIPAYNEEPSIAAVVATVKPYANKVIVVDDGSSDQTATLAKSAGAVVLQHVVNRGYGAALITGSNWAIEQGAWAVLHFDADGQFDPQDIPRLVEYLVKDDNQVVLGSRFKGRVIGLPWLRRLTLKVAIIFTWVVSGVKLSDAHNGLRLFRATAWQLMILRQDRMAFSSELIDEIKRLKLNFVEAPVTVRYTDYSKQNSKQGRWPAVRIVKDLLLGKLLR
ncbi:glycosyltransferase family 2 protein [Patescibacteria group bacterium]|nr:glycosyltransferase family 2 protein [Patescibacteria group bacterium]